MKTVTFVIRDNIDLNHLEVAKENGGPQEVLIALRPASIIDVSFSEDED